MNKKITRKFATKPKRKPRSLALGTCSADWTVEAGRCNSSPKFLFLVDEVEQLIRNEAHSLIAGRAQDVARLIIAQLTHKHGLSPNDQAQPRAGEPPIASSAE